MYNAPIVLSDDEDSPVSSNNKHDLQSSDYVIDLDSKSSDKKKNKKPTLLLVDRTSAKDKQKPKTVKRKRNFNKSEKIESIPFWINSPKDVKEIPSHIKLVCDRLIHVEKQIKKFCLERQGLLCALWKLKGDGYGNLFPDPILKSLTYDEVDKKDEQEAEENKNEELTEDSEIEDNLDYNNIEESKSSDQEDKLWQSTWLSNETQATPTKTPIFKKKAHSSWSRRTDSSCDFGISTSFKDSEMGSYSVQSDDINELTEYTKEPIEFFKNIDFSTLSQTDINTWRKFFGLKKMAEGELIKELKKIRDYFISFVEA